MGDTVRQDTYASVQRLETGVYELRANAPVQVTLPSGVVHAVTSQMLAAGQGVVRLSDTP